MLISLLLSVTLISANEAPTVGPKEGSLVIVGGGGMPPQIVKKFVDLAGGPDAELVVIPTAMEDQEIDEKREQAQAARMFGMKKVKVLHTRDRARADTEEFVAPLKTAKAVWFGGGRQWRITDAYLGTRTQKEIEAVLERGGTIGGSSAGATIQGSYLVRGAPEGPQIMISPGHEVGFSYLKDVAIDQHLIARHREADLIGVIEKYPKLLGLGLDEATAVVVKGDKFEVVGRSVVGIYDGKDHDGKPYYFLTPGEKFDLKARKRVP